MKTQQMELALDSELAPASLARRNRRQQISHWWFGQMRLAVERAPSATAQEAPRDERESESDPPFRQRQSRVFRSKLELVTAH